MRKAAIVTGIALVALSGCVRPREPAPPPTTTKAPPPAPAPVVPPAPEVDWIDRVATPGDWSYRQDGAGSAALFGAGDGATRFAIRCDGSARRIRFERAGVLDPGASARLTVTTTAGSASYALANAGGAPPMVSATVAADDPFLDRLVYTRGRFLVQVTGADDMVLPGWAEVARIVEDCRR